jgi:hypothetical protein
MEQTEIYEQQFSQGGTKTRSETAERETPKTRNSGAKRSGRFAILLTCHQSLATLLNCQSLATLLNCQSLATLLNCQSFSSSNQDLLK